MNNKTLQQLQKKLMKEYVAYRAGEISEQEYLLRAKPLDEAIGKLEMATLRCTPSLEISSSERSQWQELPEESA